MLTICSITDVKTRNIDLRTVIPATTVGVLLNIVSYSMTFTNNTVAIINKTEIVLEFILLIAFILLCTDKLKRITECSPLGEGDIAIFLSVGLTEGFMFLYKIIIYSFVFSGLFAIFLCIIRKCNKNESFPFVPFILAGCILTILEH